MKRKNKLKNLLICSAIAVGYASFMVIHEADTTKEAKRETGFAMAMNDYYSSFYLRNNYLSNVVVYNPSGTTTTRFGMEALIQIDYTYQLRQEGLYINGCNMNITIRGGGVISGIGATNYSTTIFKWFDYTQDTEETIVKDFVNHNADYEYKTFVTLKISSINNSHVVGSIELTKSSEESMYYGDDDFNYTSSESFDIDWERKGTAPLSATNISNPNFSIVTPNIYNDGNVIQYINNRVETYKEDYNEGYNAGYQAGREKGFNDGYSKGETDFYTKGYTQGYSDGESQDAVIGTIFTSVLNVGLIPVEVFLKMLNFEILGINIAGLITGLLTALIAVIIVRFVFSGKGGGE